MKKIPIKLIEDHHQAYYSWKKLGISNKPLIHLDAHMDFNFHPAKPLRQTFEEAKSKEDLVKQLSTNLTYRQLEIKEESLTNIGNYIYPAMHDGIVSDFYWVIPGNRQEFGRSLKNLDNILKSLSRQDPFKTTRFIKDKSMLRAKIYKRNFIVTTMDDLPGSIKEAILDIDTDFLTTETIRQAGTVRGVGKRFPWIWPEELVSQLKKKKIHPCCITIAYSVNGGFTPLIYKFLGDEVAVFFNGAGKRLREIILSKNRALAFLRKGKVKEAIDILKEALGGLDTVRVNAGLRNRLKAHISYALFRGYAKIEDIAKAKSCYNYTITSDKTYRVKDNNYGPSHLRRKGDLKKAGREFNLILSVDKGHSYALSGLANIFMRRKNFKKARTLFKKAYTVDRKNQEALLGLGRAELLLKNHKTALKYLKGYKSKNRIQGAVYSLLAQAYEGLRRPDEALKMYRLAHCFGINLNLYLRLFRLLKKTGIPKKHREWIKARINTYKDYRKKILSQKRKDTKKSDVKARSRIKRLLKRIDNALESVEKIDSSL